MASLTVATLEFQFLLKLPHPLLGGERALSRRPFDVRHGGALFQVERPFLGGTKFVNFRFVFPFHAFLPRLLQILRPFLGGVSGIAFMQRTLLPPPSQAVT